MKDSIRAFDTSVTQWTVRMLGVRSRPCFAFVTYLVDPVTMILISAGFMIAGYMNDSTPLFIAGVAIPSAIILAALLKLAFVRARPPTEYALAMRLKTFSLPSGHATGAVIAYGLLAYFALLHWQFPWNLVALGFLGLLIVAVGVSRVYLGAHFPSDVIAGWLLGSVTLTISISVILTV